MRNTSKSQRLFAAIPLLFAVQQAAEGVVWLTLADPDRATIHRLAVNLFLACAVVLWPMWLPLSLRAIEQRPGRRRTLDLLLGCGVVVSTYATILLVRWHPTARVAGHSISYDYQGGSGTILYLAAYIVPTIIPFFVSTARLARTIGAMLIASLLVATIVQRDALTSVWCFFAAILSGAIVLAVHRETRLTALAPAR